MKPLFTVLFGLTLALLACKKQDPGFDTYDIPYSEKITFDEGKRLLFADVISDNRCPVDVTCITGGEAVVRFNAISGTDTISFDLHRGAELTGPTDTLVFEDYHIELLEVLPIPESSVEVTKEDYVCRVLVEKLP